MGEGILIAEDEESYFFLYSDILKRADPLVKIDHVENGSDLIKYALNKDYAIIFTDNKMPGMSGLDAILELSKTKLQTPICMISGTGAEIAPQALSYGASYVLSKEPESFRKMKELYLKHKYDK